MRRSTKKKVIPLALALALALIGAALAVPTITLNVQEIGAGGPDYVVSPADNAYINWTLATNPDWVSGVSVEFDKDIPAGSTIIVKIYYYGTTPSSTAAADVQVEYPVSNDIAAGTPVSISFGSDIPISDLDRIAVVVVGPGQEYP